MLGAVAWQLRWHPLEDQKCTPAPASHMSGHAYPPAAAAGAPGRRHTARRAARCWRRLRAAAAGRLPPWCTGGSAAGLDNCNRRSQVGAAASCGRGAVRARVAVLADGRGAGWGPGMRVYAGIQRWEASGRSKSVCDRLGRRSTAQQRHSHELLRLSDRSGWMHGKKATVIIGSAMQPARWCHSPRRHRRRRRRHLPTPADACFESYFTCCAGEHEASNVKQLQD